MDWPEGFLEKHPEAKKIGNPAERIEWFVSQPAILSLFLEKAVEDPYWNSSHEKELIVLFDWISSQFFAESLPSTFFQQIIPFIQRERKAILPYLSQDIVFFVEGEKVPSNRLLYGISSPYLYEWMQRVEIEETVIVPKSISLFFFKQIDEFIREGEASTLWRLPPEELFQLLRIAHQWQLEGLEQQCSAILKRYMSWINATDWLLLAHRKKLKSLRQECFQFFSDHSHGVHFRESPPDQLILEFLDFHEDALIVAEKCSTEVTHMICSKRLTDDPHFPQVMKLFSALVGLDLSGSFAYSYRLLDIPETIKELDLSQCSWLTEALLKQICRHCFALELLALRGNSSLTTEAWGSLHFLPQLGCLDLSYCNQIDDSALQIVLEACTKLTSLQLEGCQGISSKGFYLIPEKIPQIKVLNIARTSISNAELIELGGKAKSLIHLNLSRCKGITEKGVVEFAREASFLEKLNLSHTSFHSSLYAQLKKIAPRLHVM